MWGRGSLQFSKKILSMIVNGPVEKSWLGHYFIEVFTKSVLLACPGLSFLLFALRPVQRCQQPHHDSWMVVSKIDGYLALGLGWRELFVHAHIAVGHSVWLVQFTLSLRQLTYFCVTPTWTWGSKLFLYIYRLVQKNFTPVWISRLSCCLANWPAHAQPICQFRKIQA